MTKPQPLTKEKIKEVCFDCVDRNTSGRYYLEESIFAMLEWLKEKEWYWTDFPVECKRCKRHWKIFSKDDLCQRCEIEQSCPAVYEGDEDEKD